MSNNLGETIRKARKAKGLSGGQLALYSGVCRKQISQIENGWIKVPHKATLELIGKTLEVDLSVY